MITVAGGGAAGAMAALLLARAGRRPLLIERETAAHDKVCGEFLSHEVGTALQRAGLNPETLGAAPIRAVRVAYRRQVADSSLPFLAHGLSRRVLDEALLHHAAAAGTEVVRGQVIRELDADGQLVFDGGTVRPSVLFLATGKHDLRGARRMPERSPEPLVGFKSHLTLTPANRLALRGVVEVVIFRGGYAGLQMIERDRANLCLLVRQERLAEAGGTWPGLLEALCRESPHLAARLRGADALFDRPLTVARVPYGFLHRPGPGDSPGLFRLGDQAAVIPSFSGDGVAIALHTAARATAAFLAGQSPALYHAALRRELGGQMARASRLYATARRAPALVVAAGRLWPGLLQRAALATRIPAS